MTEHRARGHADAARMIVTQWPKGSKMAMAFAKMAAAYDALADQIARPSRG